MDVNIQTIVTAKQFAEIEDYCRRKGIKSRREWVRELILREVRTNEDTLQLRR